MSAEVVVPLVTPLAEDGSVCAQSLQRHIRSLMPSASGFLPCLTSGEGWRLGHGQWRAMVELTLQFAAGRPVIVGIEQPTTEGVIAYARFAQDLGAQRIMITAPFEQGIGQDAIIEHFREVHDATDLDIYIYNESVLAGSEAEFATLQALAALKRVAGIKDSSQERRSMHEITALRRLGLRYFIGWEDQLAGGLPADGCIVSLANVEPALCGIAVDVAAVHVKSEVERLTSFYQLQRDDWYKHLKSELCQRGVLATDRLATQ